MIFFINTQFTAYSFQMVIKTWVNITTMQKTRRCPKLRTLVIQDFPVSLENQITEGSEVIFNKYV